MDDVASSDANIQKTVLDATSEALGLAILVCDRNDEIVFASRHLLQFYPISVSFLRPGTRLRDFLGAVFDSGVRTGTVPERSRRRANREEWISEHISFHWRERYETVERIGRQRWISVRKRRLSGGLSIVSISDVSDQKKREEQMQTDLERIELTESILDCLPNPVCVKDRNLNYIAVNRAFCAVHGMTADAILGRSVWDLLEPELAEKFERSDRTVLETGSDFSLPEQLVRADGDDVWVVTQKYRVGTPGKYLLVTCMNDITDIVVQQDGRAPALEPATGLRIKDYDVFEPAQNCYDPFRSLDMQNLVEPGPMLEPVIRPEQGILVATADPALEARLLSQLAGWGYDAGAVGNAAEQIAFRQVMQEAGLGVDLLLLDPAMPDAHAVAQGLAGVPVLTLAPDWNVLQLHAEILALRAGCSGGAMAPLETDSWDIVVSDTAVSHTLVSDIDVLVAEDNEINQFVFTQILEGLGLSYSMAVNGEEAVVLWQKHRPRLVLMDVSMPVMNGFDAARAIRDAEKIQGGHTPIVAVVSLALDLDIERGRAAGMDDHITKPISPDMIEGVFRTFVPASADRSKA